MISNMHKAKKSFGQNFLKSALALKKILEAGEVSKGDIILEIGPGKGALTEKLLETGAKVIAIEKDRDLIKILQEKFENEIKNKKLILINEDILEYKISDLSFSNGLAESKTRRTEDLGKTSNLLYYKIIANIPYNITGAILKKFLTEENKPERMVLMVQNEVAKRIATEKSESILSISVKAYGKPKIIMKVPARYFSPAPKVDSAILSITNISNQNFKDKKLEEKFWLLVKSGFAHKRKVLSSNLKSFNLPKEILEKFGKKRAENLPLVDWLEISKVI